MLVTSGGNDKKAFFSMQREQRDVYNMPESPTNEFNEELHSKWSSWDADAMKSVYRANVSGPVELMYKLGYMLIAQEKAPTLITVGSVSPDLSGVNHYAASKCSLLEETKRFSHHLAWDRRRRGVEAGKAVSIRWGFTDSEQSRGLLIGEDGQPTFRGTEILRATPAGKFGTPEEFGESILLIATSRVIGCEFIADGGFSDSPTV